MGRHGGRPSLSEANSPAGFARIEQFMSQVDSTEKGMFNAWQGRCLRRPGYPHFGSPSRFRGSRQRLPSRLAHTRETRIGVAGNAQGVASDSSLARRDPQG
jgi:hypothetical protein